MGYKQLIKSWHLKAIEEDYFSKFIFEYLAFIAYLNTQLFPNSDHDRQAIQKLKRDNQIRERYLVHVRTKQSLHSFWKKIKKELDNKPLGSPLRGGTVEEIKYWNCPHDRYKNKTLEEKNKRTGVLHSLEDWENMVEFWYSIRNNLFHGTKNPELKRDRLLVRYGYKTLKPLVKIFLSDLSEI
jgi:hypothetical protein